MFKGKVTNYFTKAPMAGVQVSDGMNIVLTDDEGNYSLPGWEKAHVINVNMLTECHEDWYINIEGHKGNFDFCVKPIKGTDEFCFLHTSDTEIEGRTRNDWIDFFRDAVKKEVPAFFVNTGDICREDGLRRHCYLMNSESMSCPVRYAMGNHDLCDGDYGDQIYEKYFGPTWYSFDYGQVHFIVTSIGCGDKSSCYSREEREKWLEKDLAMKDKNKAVVIFSHDFHPSSTGYGHTLPAMLEIAGDKNLKALIYGHLHVNSVYTVDGVLGLCSSRPDSGGCDSSAAGVRKISFNGTEISTEYIYNIPDAATPEAPSDWSIKLDGNVEFCPPILSNGCLWVATSTDGYPQKCGIFAIDPETGSILSTFETRAIKGSMSCHEGMLYAQDEGGKLYAINTVSQKISWIKELELPRKFTRRGVILAGKHIIAGSNSMVHAFNKDSGELIWTKNIGETDHPSNYAYDKKRNLIVCGALGSGLHALSADSGEEVWSNKQILLGWFNASTPVVEGDILYKRGHNEIGIINMDNGETVTFKKTNVNFDVSGSCVIDGDILYVATASHGVVALNKKTFDTLRVFPTENARLFTSPYAYGNIQTVETTPILDGDYLIFAASDGAVYIYNKNNGKLIKKIFVGSPIISTPIIKDGYIYVADFNGNVKRYKYFI